LIEIDLVALKAKPGRPRLHAAPGRDRGGAIHRPAFGAAEGLPATGLGGGSAPTRWRPARRGTPSRARLRPVPAPDCAVPDRGSAAELGWRLYSRGEV